MFANRQSARALAPDGDLVRITAELGDVLLDPAEGQALIAEPVVGAPFCSELGAAPEEPKGHQTIVERDTHDRLAGESGLAHEVGEV
jgi:hypothetical protein